jgi:hypothetical protein
VIGLCHGFLQVLVTTMSAVRIAKHQISGQAASRKVKKGFKDLNLSAFQGGLQR